jgi:hypothetical protein
MAIYTYLYRVCSLVSSGVGGDMFYGSCLLCLILFGNYRHIVYCIRISRHCSPYINMLPCCFPLVRALTFTSC